MAVPTHDQRDFEYAEVHHLPLIQVINNRVCDFDFDVDGAQISVEKHIGLIDDSFEEGGRIDILIESHGKAILVENKVFANDQEKQLIRYYNYARKQYKSFILLYLNREDGRLASPNSSKSEHTELNAGEHYWPISYEKEIHAFVSDLSQRLGQRVELHRICHSSVLPRGEITNRMFLQRTRNGQMVHKCYA